MAQGVAASGEKPARTPGGGIIRHQRNGFAPASLCYNAFVKPSQALDAHRAELRELVSRHGLLGARVFGSVLSGTDTDESDLDLLVEPAEKTGLMALAAFKIEAEKLLGVEVSVVTPDALPPRFRGEVLQQAKAL